MPRVLYVTEVFPWVTQTFTTAEVQGLLTEDIDVVCVSLRDPNLSAIDSDAVALLSRTKRLPAPQELRFWRLVARSVFAHPAMALEELAAASTARGLIRTTWKERLRTVLAVLRGLALGQTAARFDVIHAEFANDAATAAMVAARQARKPFTFKSHSSFNPYLLPRKTAAASSIFLATLFDRAAYFPDVESRKLVVNRCGVPARRLAERPAARRSATIVSVGTLSAKKGHEILISALGLLARNGTDVTCTIVGDGPLKKRLENAVSRLGLGSSVKFVPYVPNEQVWAYYEAARICCLPCVVTEAGDRDGLPVALIEGMAAGCICVSTPVSGVPELIEDCETGLLAVPGDPKSLAHQLERALLDDALGRHLVARGQARVRAAFNLDENVSAMASAFREIASAGSAGT
jgi:colanic acid/amylovoran biosynthesis glycosyltransferase